MSNSTGKKDTKKEKEKELQDIVMDMLLKGEKKEDILVTLQETGLTEEESKNVYEKVKKDYEESLGTEMEKKTEELFREKEEEIMERMDDKIEKLKKDLKTKRNLKSTEQKEYIDKKTNKLEERVDELQSQLFTFRATMKNKVEKISETIGGSGLDKNIKKSIAVIMIIIAITMIAYPLINYNTTITLLEEDISRGMINLLFHIALIAGALILGKYGKDIYIASHKQKLEEIGHDWVEKNQKRR